MKRILALLAFFALNLPSVSEAAQMIRKVRVTCCVQQEFEMPAFDKRFGTLTEVGLSIKSLSVFYFFGSNSTPEFSLLVPNDVSSVELTWKDNLVYQTYNGPGLLYLIYGVVPPYYRASFKRVDTFTTSIPLSLYDPIDAEKIRTQKPKISVFLDLSPTIWGVNTNPFAYMRQTMDIGVIYKYDRSAVPEPDIWFLMISGFGIVGIRLRRSKENIICSNG